jgi:hypothetical protein
MKTTSVTFEFVVQDMGLLPYVTGYRAGYKAAKAADGPGGSGYDAAYRTGMQVRIFKPYDRLV